MPQQAEQLQAHRHNDPAFTATRRELVAALVEGDPVAWEKVVHDYDGLLRAIARAHGLRPIEVTEVAQTTWLRLVEHLGSLRAPEALGAWLATTARREAGRVRQLAMRQLLVADEASLDARGPANPPVDAPILVWERDATVRRAMEALPRRCRELLSLLMDDPQPSYAAVSAKLRMPVGSIGPTRARCLACLRGRTELRQLLN
jgi:RNA polymerase sigma factor (sigma-70 family)